jgi:phage/plasmid-associated DNA primase
MFENYIRFGVKISVKDGKKKVSGIPKNWQNLTESMYNNEKNFAILVGKTNDILVIDIDNKEDMPGKQWFEENIQKICELDTLVTETINGGYHVYYKYNEKVKNANNFLGLFIDVLVERKCVYEGFGYNVIRNFEPKEMDEKTLELFKKLEKTLGKKEEKAVVKYQEKPMVISDPIKLRKFNSKIPTDLNCEWSMELLDDGGYKCVPDTNVCIVSGKIHSEKNHSAVFINPDKSVIKHCFSCHLRAYSKKEAQQIYNEFHVVMELRREEDTIHEQLTEKLLEFGSNENCARDDFGNVYKRKKKYAYVYYKSASEFIREKFKNNRMFKKLPNNMDNLLKFMKNCDYSKFPMIYPSKKYIGFSNGVLDIENVTFIQEKDVPDEMIVKKYLNVPFSGETETPLFDSIILYQLKNKSEEEIKEIMDFVYFCMGRLFGIRDKYDFTLYLMGESGCGKSLIIDIMKNFFRDIGAISSTFEKTFGLSYLYNKDLIVCDDLPKDFSKVLPQTLFQSCISGGEMSIAIKGGDAKTINWEVPLLFAGNYNPDYVDKGQISRRILTLTFENIVTEKDRDISLLSEILATEMDKLSFKCLLKYKKTLELKNKKGIWDICPKYFKENQEELKMDRNPLYRFLKEHSRYKEGNFVSIEDMREEFSNYLGKRVSKLDKGTILSVDSRYEVKIIKICKKCLKEVGDCCEEYNRSERITTRIVYNIELHNE